MAQATVKELEQAKQEMLLLKALPENYSIDIDKKTLNILVKGPSLGFCISNKAVVESYYRSEFVPMLDKLIELEDKGGLTALEQYMENK